MSWSRRPTATRCSAVRWRDLVRRILARLDVTLLARPEEVALLDQRLAPVVHLLLEKKIWRFEPGSRRRTQARIRYRRRVLDQLLPGLRQQVFLPAGKRADRRDPLHLRTMGTRETK